MNTTNFAATRTALDTFGVAPGPRTRATLTALLRAASATEVAAGRGPARRMMMPGSLRRSGSEADARNTVPLWVAGNTPMLAMPEESPQRATGNLVAQVLRSPRMLLMPLTPTAATFTARVLSESADPDAGWAGQCLSVLGGLTSSSKLLVLTSALDRTFHLPAGAPKHDLALWASWFGTSRSLTGARSMAAAVLADHTRSGPENQGRATLSGQVRHWQMAVQQIEDSTLDDLGGRSATRAAAAFIAAGSVNDGFAAMCRLDPLLRPLHLLSGEVAKVTSLRRTQRADDIVATFALPAKVKPGAMVLVDDHRVHDFSVRTVSYDEAGVELVAYGRARRSRQYALPSAGIAAPAPFFSHGKVAVARWNSADTATSKLRDLPPVAMPVDVAVAGAAPA